MGCAQSVALQPVKSGAPLDSDTLSTILNASTEAVILADASHTIKFANATAVQMFGHSEEQLYGQPISIVLPTHRLDDPADIHYVAARHKLGRDVLVDMHRVPLASETHHKCILYTFVNVAAQRSLEKQFETIFESAQNGLIMVNGGGNITLVNAQMERMFGYGREEIVGSQLEMLVPERFRARHVDLRRQYSGRPVARMMGVGRDLYGRRKNGSEFAIEIGLSPIDRGDDRMVLASIVDISERKRIEDRFHLVVQAAPNGMIMINADGCIVLVNAQALRMFGYSEERLLGEKIEILLPTRLHGSHVAQRASFLAAPSNRSMGAGRELFGRRSDGTEFPIEIGLNPVHTSEGLLVLAAVVDITERKRLEDRFRMVVEASPNALVLVNPSGCVVLFNSQAESMFGFNRDEVVGEPVERLLPLRFKDRHPDLRNAYFDNPISRPMGVGRELFARRKDGTEFPIEIGLNPLRTREGTLVLSSIVDITERKNGERLQQERDAAEREAKSRSSILAAMSHEIRTPLTGLIGSLDLLADSALQAEQTTLVRTIKLCSDALLGTINDILDFSKLDAERVDVEKIPFNIKRLLEESSSVFYPQLKAKGLAWCITIDSSVPEIMLGDPGRLRQVIMNVVGNAIKFTSAGKVSLDVRCSPSGDNGVAKLLLSVTDSGIGMTRKTQDRLFQPFIQADTSTTRKYGGTGLGLAICKRLLALMGGDIRVTSELGTGSTVFFEVAAQAAKAEEYILPPDSVAVPPLSSSLHSHSCSSGSINIDAAVLEAAAGLSSVNAPPPELPASMGVPPFLTTNTGGGCVFANLSSARSSSDGSGSTPLSCPVSGHMKTQRSGSGDASPPSCPFSGHKALISATGDPFAHAQAHAQALAVQPAPLPGKIKPSILLVEDDTVSQMVVAKMLQKLQCSVQLASNGAAALEVLAEDSSIDLVLMDCEMPVMDGFSAVAEIRRLALVNRHGRSMPVCAMTANALAGDREHCLKYGMDDYISKPFRISELQSTLAKWV